MKTRKKSNGREMPPSGRQRFRHGAVMTPLTVLVLIISFFAVYFASKRTDSRRQTRTSFVMGTALTQTVYSESAGHSLDIITRIEAQSREWDNRLSWRIEDSETAQINAAAGEEIGLDSRIDSGLYRQFYSRKLFQELSALFEYTNGAFDLTVLPLSRLWNVESDNPRVPSAEEIAAAKALVGYNKVLSYSDALFLPEKGMGLDLGAAGKGAVLDGANEILLAEEAVSMSQKNTVGAVVSCGGSILVYGENNGDPWKIGIRHPRNPGELLGDMEIGKTVCVSTSGDYEKYFIKNGVRYHHIIDAATGYPAQSGLISVTVIVPAQTYVPGAAYTPDSPGAMSDALSTACFILGKEKSLR
ncbi:MAG: FAD:protein FMN transferase, partial [Oscillospiraceae bacterium]|nr:FAD:protein FMN transferase [Oscillospiraceae bacterium]